MGIHIPCNLLRERIVNKKHLTGKETLLKTEIPLC